MVVSLSWFHPLFLLCGAGVFVPLLSLSKDPSKSVFRRYPWIVGSVLAGLALILSVVPNPIEDGVREGYSWLSTTEEFMTNVAESRPLIGDGAESGVLLRDFPSPHCVVACRVIHVAPAKDVGGKPLPFRYRASPIDYRDSFFGITCTQPAKIWGCACHANGGHFVTRTGFQLEPSACSFATEGCQGCAEKVQWIRHDPRFVRVDFFGHCASVAGGPCHSSSFQWTASGTKTSGKNCRTPRNVFVVARTSG